MQKVRGAGLKYYGLVALGAAASAIAFSVIRVVYYFWMDLRPEMSPMMFLIFSPLVALAFSLISVVLEVFLCVLMPRMFRALPFVVGVSYSSLLLVLINKWFLLVFLVFNPVTLHCWLAVRHKHAR
ncbi:hypothetical protein [Lysobacter sp. Root690]|uniref:hypothetical protein n=1 Tax=Lysobacter sp. Root690 TaxID=1736588 RepID=UPI0012F7E945|nr:hypothetical protein [Lysobacter sp. Root690]